MGEKRIVKEKKKPKQDKPKPVKSEPTTAPDPIIVPKRKSNEREQ